MNETKRDDVIVLDAKLLRAISKLEKAGRMPMRVVLPDGRFTWRRSDIETWLKNRPLRSR
jgi:predicted DNA-binding transcriptional regulator AlpA